MEETDPARILPAKKQAVEATSSSGGTVPMVPPMGMPMSPHAPLAGEQAQQVGTRHELYTADMPAEGFGSPAVAVPESRLMPALPAEPGIAPTVAHAAVPAMTARVTEPVQPYDMRPVERVPSDDVHILPIEDKPCTCCGGFHDGQESRHFDRDDDRHTGDPHDREHGDREHGDREHGDRGHDAHDRGHDAHDREHGDRGQDTHDRQDAVHDNRPGDDVPTDSKADDDCCCACCGDEHPGLENGTGNGTPGDATDTDEDSDEDSDDEDADGEGSAGDDSEEDSDDDCPADDEGDGENGEDTDNLGHGNADDDEHQDDDSDSDSDSDGPGKDEDWDRCGNGADDDPGKGDDKPGGDKPGGDKPGGDKPGDGPGRPHGDSSGHDGGTPSKPVTPVTPGQSTDSNYAVDPGKPTTPAIPGDRATMAPPLSKPTQPTQAGMTVPGKPLGQQTPANQSGGSPTTPAIPASQKIATPLTPTTSMMPPVAPVGNNGQGNGNEGNGSGTEGSGTGGDQPQFYTSEPPPGFQGNNQGNGNGNGNGQDDGNGNGEGTPEQPLVPAVRMTKPAVVQGVPANGQGNGQGNGNGNGNGNNPLFSTSGGPGLAPPPTDGNVGPDPNVKFDEASFNQLTAVIGGVRDTIGKATRNDVTYLDAELLVQPNSQTWEPATKLVQRGGIFGGSVDTENTSLEKTLKTFHESLQLAKEVFKETDDLASYDATMFSTNYPGFNSGGMPGGAF